MSNFMESLLGYIDSDDSVLMVSSMKKQISFVLECLYAWFFSGTASYIVAITNKGMFIGEYTIFQSLNKNNYYYFEDIESLNFSNESTQSLSLTLKNKTVIKLRYNCIDFSPLSVFSEEILLFAQSKIGECG